MEINDRIQHIVGKLFNGNKSQFAKAINEAPTSVSNILGERKSLPSAKFLSSIANSIESVNIVWLLTGKGEMLKDSNTTPMITEKDFNEYVYLLPVSAHGGTLSDFVASIDEKSCEKIISPIRDADFAITVLGDSMAPEYPNGSQILIKRINEKAFIDWGRAYVLDTCNGVVIKRIFPPEEKNSSYVKCVSINPEYPPFEVSMKDVYGMYRVMLCMAPK